MQVFAQGLKHTALPGAGAGLEAGAPDCARFLSCRGLTVEPPNPRSSMRSPAIGIAFMPVEDGVDGVFRFGPR